MTGSRKIILINQAQIIAMPRRSSKDECCNWSDHKRRGKIGFALFLLLVGLFWLARDMGYLASLPFWPLVLIFFAAMIMFSRE